MIKWICLIFMFVSTYGESYYQTRDCPTIDNRPHHTGPSECVADSATENVVSNLSTEPNNLTAGVPNNLSKWSKGKEFDGKYEVPYRFDSNLPFETKEAVYFGMVIIERGSNIIFIKKRNNDTNYIFIEQPKNDDVCKSYVGKQKRGQSLKLASRCRTPNVVTHELLHAIGMKHEHQRTDRSVENGTWDGARVAPDPTIEALTQYDPFSIMHYALPFNVSLRAEDNWTKTDELIARGRRAFPSICDYYGINQIYEGHVQSPPCTNVRIFPPWLEATDEGKQKWKKYYPNMNKNGHGMTWACNYLSGQLFKGVPMISHLRQERTLCQFHANSMYPNFSWIPYAEEVTYPIPGLNYSEFKTFPLKIKPNWMTHHICDCLGPPPFVNDLRDHSMYQTCLECVHFEDTTIDVLKCIAKESGDYFATLSYLLDNYNTTQYYLINPKSS